MLDILVDDLIQIAFGCLIYIIHSVSIDRKNMWNYSLMIQRKLN
jgi:hypothetical protein